jgi:uncharacterized membrane protein YdjX (TVP38/TMEM64 family)
MSGAEGRSRRWWQLLILAAILAAIVGIAVLAAPHVTRTKVESLVRSAGAWGPLAVIGLQIAQILIAPIPGVFIPILAGILYGPVAGTVITVVGTVLGSGIAYAIGRRAGLPLIRRWAGEKNVARAQKLVGGSRWIALAVLFLLPFTPSDAICFAAGMIGMRASRFAPAVLLGRVPKDAALALAGAGLLQLGHLVRGA